MRKGVGKSCDGSVWVKEKLDFVDAEADDVGRIKEKKERRLAAKNYRLSFLRLLRTVVYETCFSMSVCCCVCKVCGGYFVV
jgi:hypothetical protein